MAQYVTMASLKLASKSLTAVKSTIHQRGFGQTVRILNDSTKGTAMEVCVVTAGQGPLYAARNTLSTPLAIAKYTPARTTSICVVGDHGPLYKEEKKAEEKAEGKNEEDEA